MQLIKHLFAFPVYIIGNIGGGLCKHKHTYKAHMKGLDGDYDREMIEAGFFMWMLIVIIYYVKIFR